MASVIPCDMCESAEPARNNAASAQSRVRRDREEKVASATKRPLPLAGLPRPGLVCSGTLSDFSRHCLERINSLEIQLCQTEPVEFEFEGAGASTGWARSRCRFQELFNCIERLNTVTFIDPPPLQRDELLVQAKFWAAWGFPPRFGLSDAELALQADFHLEISTVMGRSGEIRRWLLSHGVAQCLKGDAVLTLCRRLADPAVARNAAAAVRVLLVAKAAVDHRDITGRTPLMLAAERGHLGLCSELLRAKADVHAEDWLGETAATKASPKDTRLQELLYESAREEDAVMKDAPLSQRQLPQPKLLFAEDDVEAWEALPLDLPARLLAIREYLTMHCGQPDLKNKRRWFQELCRVVMLLQHDYIDLDGLYMSSAFSDDLWHEEYICAEEMLLGPSRGFKDKRDLLLQPRATCDSQTMLLWKEAEFWVGFGGPPPRSAQNEEELELQLRTPWHYDSYVTGDICINEEAVAPWLLSYGIDVTKDRDILLKLSPQFSHGSDMPHCHVETIRVLLAAKAMVDPRDVYRRTPLMHACHNHSWEVAELLVNQGANVFASDLAGNSALDYCGAGSLKGGACIGLHSPALWRSWQAHPALHTMPASIMFRLAIDERRLLQWVIENEESGNLTAGHPAMIEAHRLGHNDLMRQLRQKSGRVPTGWSCLSEELVQIIVKVTLQVTDDMRNQIRLKRQPTRSMMPAAALCTSCRTLNRTFVSLMQKMPTSPPWGRTDSEASDDCCRIYFDKAWCGHPQDVCKILMYQPVVTRVQSLIAMMKNAVKASECCDCDCMYEFEEEYFDESLVPQLCKSLDTPDKAMRFFRGIDLVPSSKVPEDLSRLEFIHQQHVEGAEDNRNFRDVARVFQIICAMSAFKSKSLVLVNERAKTIASMLARHPGPWSRAKEVRLLTSCLYAFYGPDDDLFYDCSVDEPEVYWQFSEGDVISLAFDVAPFHTARWRLQWLFGEGQKLDPFCDSLCSALVYFMPSEQVVGIANVIQHWDLTTSLPLLGELYKRSHPLREALLEAVVQCTRDKPAIAIDASPAAVLAECLYSVALVLDVPDLQQFIGAAAKGAGANQIDIWKELAAQLARPQEGEGFKCNGTTCSCGYTYRRKPARIESKEQVVAFITSHIDSSYMLPDMSDPYGPFAADAVYVHLSNEVDDDGDDY